MKNKNFVKQNLLIIAAIILGWIFGGYINNYEYQ